MYFPVPSGYHSHTHPLLLPSISGLPVPWRVEPLEGKLVLAPSRVAGSMASLKSCLAAFVLVISMGIEMVLEWGFLLFVVISMWIEMGIEMVIYPIYDDLNTKR